MNSKIISIGTAVPGHHAEQGQIFQFMKKMYDDKLASRKLNALFRFSGIKTRHSVVPDFENSQASVFFKPKETQPNVEQRMEKFGENAAGLGIVAIRRALEDADMSPDEVTHLITVTCTGMAAPGLNAEIINKLGLKNDIYNTSVNYMGCGAAFHALRMADFIVRSDEKAGVLIVSVELCTLHFQPKNTKDHLLSNTIFGDGSAAVVVTSGNNVQPSFSIHGFYSLLISSGHDLMGWYVKPLGFEMILSSELPDFVGDEIREALDKALVYYQLDNPEDIHYWAVHPGGKRILDEVKSALQLNNELQHSYNVLREFGNMSSASVLFVLKEMMHKKAAKNEKLMAIGFGPGLSVETLLLEYA